MVNYLAPSFAPRADRLLAQLADWLIGAIPVLLALAASTISESLVPVLSLAGMVWWIGYFLLADGLPHGQSYGKKVFSMRVVSAETGEPCTFFQSFIRNLLLSVLGPLDWIFIFGEQHQRLGDKAAGTIVIAD